jgi:class 3 adenylate cyclase/Tfp pilus assembly protein PilF
MRPFQKILLLVCLWLLNFNLGYGQPHLDSLWGVWQNTENADTIRLQAIDKLAMPGFVYSQPDSARALAQIEYELAEKIDHKNFMASALNIQGVAHTMQDNYPKAIDFFIQTKTLYEEINNKPGLASVQNNLASVYDRMGEYDKSFEYYKESIGIMEELGREKGLIFPLINLGYNYANRGELDESLETFERAVEIAEKYDHGPGVFNSLSGIGYCYELKEDDPKALEYYLKSLELCKQTGPELSTVQMLNTIGDSYLRLNQPEKAIVYCKEGLERAEKATSLMAQRNACNCLFTAYKSLDQNQLALQYHEQLTTIKDSMFNEENTKELTRLEMQYEFDKKEAVAKAEQEKKDALAAQELKKQKLERNGFMAGFAVVLVFALVFFGQRNRIGKEKKRSDDLLLNILPEETALELKAKGSAESKLIENTTVLFTDFKGFTAMSETMTANELVKNINECFSAFDHIMEKHGVEKIKTIGDAYMAAGGLPTPNATHVKDVVLAGLEIAEFMNQRARTRKEKGLPHFEIRIGINTGPVVAGIVGVKKFQYDIWGDTVNTASRMESSGEPGKVNISNTTYNLLKDDSDFTFESRGKIQAKGKGEIEMWFVNKI